MNEDAAYDSIRRAFEAGRLAQAYIIAGAMAGGASTLADRIVQIVFCGQRPGPCGVCQGCRLAAEHAHPDLVIVEPQSKARMIRVDEVRKIQGLVFQTAYAGGWKVCVVRNADRMTEEGANAFLKTLEEPPPRMLFLLLTDSPQSLLPTILSRCQTIRLAAEPDALPGEWDAAFRGLLSDSAGAAGLTEAVSVAERTTLLLKEMKDTVLAAEKEKARASNLDEEREVIEARASAGYRELRTTMMRMLLHWHRDVMLLKWGGDESTVFHRDQLPRLKGAAGGVTPAGALRNVRVVEGMNRRFERNLPEKLVLAEGLLDMRKR